MAKLRSDSTFSSLPDLIKDQVDEMLLAGESYKKVQDYLREDGITVSQTSIYEYYHNHILPLKYRRNTRTAAAIAQIELGEIDAATKIALQQSTYEALTEGNHKAAKMYMDLLLKAQAMEQSERKLKMLEEQRDEAKAIAQQALDAGRTAKGLTPETLEKLQEALKNI